MSALTIESLGLSKEELSERLVQKLADDLMTSWRTDEDGDAVASGGTPFRRGLEKKVLARIDRAIETIAGQHVLPNVAAYVEGLCLQETNKWGEKVGMPVTFIAYLVARAEAYLKEPVDYSGKAKGEGDTYNWKATQTRVASLVHQHLQYSIENAMKAALQTANSAIVAGLEEAVKIKLAEVAQSLKVTTKVGG